MKRCCFPEAARPSNCATSSSESLFTAASVPDKLDVIREGDTDLQITPIFFLTSLDSILAIFIEVK